jgi:hypothetical protein
VGAVLALPKGATVYAASNRDRFRTYASCHALTWYKYMLNKGMDISNGSVYFITECTKSVNWGIAVFYARQRASNNIRFIIDGESYCWDSRGKVEARVGPESTDITVSDGGVPNQCVFLRGYKVMLRSDIWKKLKSTTIVTSNDGGFSLTQIMGTSHSLGNGVSSASREADSFHQSMSDNQNTPDPSHRDQAHQLTGIQALQGSLSKAAEAFSELETLNDQKLGSPGGDIILVEEFFSEVAPVCIFILDHLRVLKPLYQLHPSDLINVMLLQLVSFCS